MTFTDAALAQPLCSSGASRNEHLTVDFEEDRITIFILDAALNSTKSCKQPHLYKPNGLNFRQVSSI